MPRKSSELILLGSGVLSGHRKIGPLCTIHSPSKVTFRKGATLVLPSYQFGRPLPSEDQPFELSELCLNKTSSSEDSYSKTYKDESKSSTLMFNMTFLSDMEVDTKKKDESQPSRILASCRTSVDRVCSMEFLKERLIQHPTSSNLLYLLSLSLIHHHH